VEDQLADVQKGFKVRNWLAAPVEPSVPQSTWLTAEKSAFPVLQKIVGDRSSATMDRTYAGSCTWLNGVYWTECLKPGVRTTLIKNMGDVGRTKVESVTAQVETSLLFPLLRGRDVQAWHAAPSATILVPHDPTDFSNPLPLAEMKRKSSQKEHRRIVQLSKRCHDVAASRGETKELELNLASAAACLWRIPKDEQTFLLNAYEEIQGFRRRRSHSVTAGYCEEP
jgi:hypothetical protein